MHKKEKIDYKNIEISKFAVNKILSTKEVLSLTNGNLPHHIIPKNFFGVFVSNISFDETSISESENLEKNITRGKSPNYEIEKG